MATTSSPGRSSRSATASSRASSRPGARPISPIATPRTSTANAALWCASLARAGFLKLCVADGKHRPDVRSLAIARETLAYHRALADFAFAMQGLGSGAISLFGTIEQKRKWLPRVASGEAIAAFAMTEPDVRIGRGEHRHVGHARRQRMGAGRREDVDLQRRDRRFLRDLRAHRRRRGRAGAVGIHRPGRSGRCRRAYRSRCAAPARAAALRQRPHPRGRDHRRTRRGVPRRHGDAEPVSSDGRRCRARLRPSRAR